MNSRNEENKNGDRPAAEQDGHESVLNSPNSSPDGASEKDTDQAGPAENPIAHLTWIDDEAQSLLGYIHRQNGEMLDYLRMDANPRRKLSRLSIGLFTVVLLGTIAGSVLLVNQGVGLRELLVCSVGELILFVLVAVSILSDLRPKRSEAAELLLDPQNRIGVQQYQLRELNGLLAKWQTLLESLKQKQRNLVAQNHGLHETATAWEARIQNLQSQYRGMESELGSRQKELLDIKQQVANSSDELSVRKQECEEISNTIDVLRQKVTERELFLAEVDHRIADKEAVFQTIQNEIQERECDSAIKLGELEQLAANVAAKSEEQRSLTAIVSELKKTQVELERNQEGLKRAVAEAAEELRDKQRSLSDICQQLEVANAASTLSVRGMENVDSVFSRVAQGLSVRQITEDLTENGNQQGDSSPWSEQSLLHTASHPLHAEMVGQMQRCDEHDEQIASLKAEIIGLEHTVADLRCANQLLQSQIAATGGSKKEVLGEELPSVDHFESLLAMSSRQVRDKSETVAEVAVAKTKELEQRLSELAVAEAKLKQVETDCILANGQLEKARKNHVQLQEAASELELVTIQRNQDLVSLEDTLSSIRMAIAKEEGLLTELLGNISNRGQRSLEVKVRSAELEEVEDRIRIAQDQLIQIIDELHAKETAYEFRVRELESAVITSSAEVDGLRSMKESLDFEIQELRTTTEALNREIAAGEEKKLELADVEANLKRLLDEKESAERAIEEGWTTLDELYSTIAELKESQLKDAEQQVREFEERSVFLKSEIEIQQERLNAIWTESKEIDAKLGELAEAEAELKQLKTDITVQETQRDALKSQQVTIAANISVLEERRMELQKDLELLANELADSVRRKAEMECSLSVAVQALDDIREQQSNGIHVIACLEKQRVSEQASLEELRRRSELESREWNERRSKIELDIDLARKRSVIADCELNTLLQNIQKQIVDRDQLELQRDQLKSDIASFQIQLQEHQEAVSEAEIALQQRRTQQKDLQKKLFDEQAEVKALAQMKENLSAQIIQAENRIQELQQLERQYSTTKCQAEDLQQSLVELKKKRLVLERDCQQVESNLQVLRDNESQLRSTCVQLRSDSDNARIDLNQQMAQLRELQVQRSSSENSLKKIQAQYSDLSSTVAALQAEGRRADASCEDCRRQLRHLEQDVVQAQKVCGEWQEYLHRLQVESKQIVERKAALEASTRDIAIREKIAKDELLQNRSQNTELTVEHKRLRIAISQAEEQLLLHRQELEKLAQAQSEILQSCERSKLDLAQLGNQIESRTARLKEIESRHDAVTADLSEAERRLQLTRAVSDDVEGECIQRRARLADFEQEVKAYRKQVREHTIAVNDLKQELADLESRKRSLEDHTRNLEAQTAALSGIESDIAEKSSILARLRSDIAQSKDKLVASESQVRQASFTLDSIAASLSHRQQDLEETESKLALLQDVSDQLVVQNQQKESELEGLRRQEDQAIACIRELRDGIELLQAEKRIAEQTLNEESRRLSQVLIDRDAIEAEAARKIGEVEQLSQKAASLAAQIAIAEERQRSIEAAVESHSSEIESLSNRIEQLQLRKIALSDSLGELEIRRGESEAQVQGLHELKLQVQAEITSLSQSRESVIVELQDLETRRQTLSEQLSAIEMEASQLNEKQALHAASLAVANERSQAMDFELYQESAVGKPSLVDEQAQVLRGLTLAVGGNDTEQFGEPEMNQLVRVVESIEMDMESVVGYSPAPTDGSGRSAKAEGRDVWADVMELAQST